MQTFSRFFQKAEIRVSYFAITRRLQAALPAVRLSACPPVCLSTKHNIILSEQKKEEMKWINLGADNCPGSCTCHNKLYTVHTERERAKRYYQAWYFFLVFACSAQLYYISSVSLSSISLKKKKISSTFKINLSSTQTPLFLSFLLLSSLSLFCHTIV